MATDREASECSSAQNGVAETRRPQQTVPLHHRTPLTGTEKNSQRKTKRKQQNEENKRNDESRDDEVRANADFISCKQADRSNNEILLDQTPRKRSRKVDKPPTAGDIHNEPQQDYAHTNHAQRIERCCNCTRTSTCRTSRCECIRRNWPCRNCACLKNCDNLAEDPHPLEVTYSRYRIQDTL